MLENFAVMELARQLTWSGERGRLYHYRTKDQIEVDAVIETPDGRVIAAEVKAGATVRTEDLAGLRNLASHLGDKFVAGYVLYTGQQTLPFGGKIKACRWTRSGTYRPDSSQPTPYYPWPPPSSKPATPPRPSESGHARDPPLRASR